jgi:hypothetical protein
MIQKKLLMTFLSIAITSGCATGVSKKASEESVNDYQNGLYTQAAQNLEQNLGLINKETGAMLPIEAKKSFVIAHLDVGENWRMAGNSARSLAHFDAVELLLKSEDTEGVVTKTGEAFGSAFINDNVRSYEPSPSERIVTNYYKAMSYWGIGDLDNARVEFNRAQDRARIAIEAYAKDIEKAKKEAEESKANVSEPTQELLNEVNDWEVFDDFLNPGVTYANALFLAQSSYKDFSKARDFLIRVRSMIGPSNVIDSDIEALENGTFGDKKYVWILMETGMSPYLDDRRLDIPFPIDDKLLVASIALPKLVERSQNLSVNHIMFNSKPIQSDLIGDMNKIMQTEFKARWPSVVTRAAIGAVTKLGIQNEMNKKGGYAGLLTALASAVITQADTRYWQLMPGYWSLARYEINEGDELLIPYGNNGAFEAVNVNQDESSMIYLKQPTAMAKPLIKVYKL